MSIEFCLVMVTAMMAVCQIVTVYFFTKLREKPEKICSVPNIYNTNTSANDNSKNPYNGVDSRDYKNDYTNTYRVEKEYNSSTHTKGDGHDVCTEVKKEATMA